METLTSDYLYWAFVSYSSNDKSWGRWLHRAIESYGIPAQLVNNPTPAGHPAPKRFRPLFRDREELPASADLSAQIDDALRSSRYLIVVCSKHAAQSRWVNKEIETFQELGRNNRILAIIVDGEPNTGDERECFPPALRKCEPIAADARPDGDGKANAKLKLLAGMLGVNFDTLKQRDVRRRTRRLQILLGLSILLASIFACLSWYANQQRLIALEQRRIAMERMVDLRQVISTLLWDMVDTVDDLPGPLAVKDAMLTGVDAYLSKLSDEDRDDKGLLRELVKTNEKLGGVRFSQGRLTEARKIYEHGLSSALQLAEQDKSNAFYQSDVAANHLGIGKACLLQCKLNEAKVHFLACVDLITELKRTLPDYKPFHEAMARAYKGLSLVNFEQGNSEKALWYMHESQGVCETLVGRNPQQATLSLELASVYRQLAKLLRNVSNSSSALTYANKSISLCGRVLQDLPHDRFGRREQALGYLEIAEIFLETGDIKISLSSASMGLNALQALYESDPYNAIERLDLATALVTHGVVLRGEGRLEESVEQLLKAKSMSAEVLKIDLSNIEAKTVEAFASGNLAITQKMSGLA